jgi:conjugal transfer pilus assembly protein TraW
VIRLYQSVSFQMTAIYSHLRLRSFILSVIIAFICFFSLTAYRAPLQAKDFGQLGEAYPIIEVDLLSAIEAKLKSFQASGKIDALNRDLKEKSIARVRRPPPVAGLSSALQKRSWVHDPSTIVEDDIRDTKGNLIALRGQRVNPMQFVRLTQDLVFVDGNNRSEIDWAVANWTSIKSKIIFVSGSPFDEMKGYQRRFFFDQGGQLTTKFGIRHTPASVTSNGEMLSVTEHVVKGASK